MAGIIQFTGWVGEKTATAVPEVDKASVEPPEEAETWKVEAVAFTT
jgi:hypothetical protein